MASRSLVYRSSCLQEKPKPLTPRDRTNENDKCLNQEQGGVCLRSLATCLRQHGAEVVHLDAKRQDLLLHLFLGVRPATLHYIITAHQMDAPTR